MRVRRDRNIPNRGNRMCKSLEVRELGELYAWGTERNSVCPETEDVSAFPAERLGQW